jgi:hypothetical protein
MRIFCSSYKTKLIVFRIYSIHLGKKYRVERNFVGYDTQIVPPPPMILTFPQKGSPHFSEKKKG